MLTLIKLLKIVLPVATVTTATIITTSLVSSSKNNLEKNKQEQDKLLLDFEKPVKDFKEEIMLYSDKGQADNATVSKDQAEKLKDVQLKDTSDVTKNLTEAIQGSPKPQNNGDLTRENKPLSDSTQTNESKQTSEITDKSNLSVLTASSEDEEENKLKTGAKSDEETLSKSELSKSDSNFQILNNDDAQSENPASTEGGDLEMSGIKSILQEPQSQGESIEQQDFKNLSQKSTLNTETQGSDVSAKDVDGSKDQGEQNLENSEKLGNNIRQDGDLGSSSDSGITPSEENLNELKSLLDELQSTTQELEGFVLN